MVANSPVDNSRLDRTENGLLAPQTTIANSRSTVQLRSTRSTSWLKHSVEQAFAGALQNDGSLDRVNRRRFEECSSTSSVVAESRRAGASRRICSCASGNYRPIGSSSKIAKIERDSNQQSSQMPVEGSSTKWIGQTSRRLVALNLARLLTSATCRVNVGSPPSAGRSEEYLW